MIEQLEALKKKLIFRSWHRGMREMDLIIGSFADKYIHGFTEAQVKTFEELLEVSDPDIYNWMTGREETPKEHDHDVMALLKQHHFDREFSRA